MSSSKDRALDLDALDRAIRVYYSNRSEDVDDAKRIIVAAIEAGKFPPDLHPADLVNSCLLGNRDDDYLSIRAHALHVLRDPGRIGTMSTGERLAMALLFERQDWLRGDSYAWAAQRIGNGWLRAIVNVEVDLRWMDPLALTRTRSVV